MQSFTESSTNNLLRLYGLASTNTQAIVAGNFEQGFSAEVQYQHGRLLEYITGAAVTHDATDTPDIKHTFGAADTPPAFTLESGVDASTDIVQRYEGCRLTSLALRLGLGGVVTLGVDGMCQQVVDSATSQSSVISALAPLTGFMGAVSTGTAASEVAVADVQNVEVIFRMDPVRLFGLGDRIAKDLQMTKKQYEFSFSAGFNSIVEYERFLGSTSPSATSTPTLPSFILNINNAVALASGRRQIYLNLTGASYETAGNPRNIDGFIIQDFTGWATTLNSFYCYENITSANWG